MSEQTRELYQEMVLEHSRRPRNFGRLPKPSASAEGFNPLCGDRLALDVALEGGRIRQVAFEGQGCAISKASASLMTEAIMGRTVAEALGLFRAFHALLTQGPASGLDLAPLGKLVALSGVHEFPSRVKCAALCWHALQSALAGAEAAASFSVPPEA